MKIKTLGLCAAFMIAANAHSLENTLEINHKTGFAYPEAGSQEKAVRPHATELSYKAKHELSFGKSSFDVKLTQDRDTYKTKNFDIDLKGELQASSKAFGVSYENSGFKDIFFTTEVATSTDNHNIFKKAATHVSNGLAFSWKTSNFASVETKFSVLTSSLKEAYKADKSLAPVTIKQSIKSLFIPMLSSSAQFVTDFSVTRLDKHNYSAKSSVGVNYDLGSLIGLAKESMLWSVNFDQNAFTKFKKDATHLSQSDHRMGLSTKVSYCF